MKHEFWFFGRPLDQERWIIDPGEEHHIYKVLRLKGGELINLIDGAGSLVRVCLSAAQESARGHCVQEIIYPSDGRFRPEKGIDLALGALKWREAEDIIAPLVELGLGRLWIFFQSHSPKNANSQKELQRYELLAKSALKQSKRLWLPEFKVFPDLESLIIRAKELNPRLYPCHGSAESKHDLRGLAAINPGLEPLAIIGSESGLSDLDSEILRKYGSQAFSLGPYILRAKTAAIATVAQLSPGL